MTSSETKVPTFEDALRNYPLTQAERERIAQLAQKPSIPRHVITIYAPRTSLYKRGFSKKEKVPGFRQGKEGFNKLAIPKLIEYLKEPTFRNYEYCWQIYKFAAADFVIRELPKLNQLFLALAPEGSSSAELLGTIFANVEEYEVSTEDIRKFYECWWLDRVQNFDELAAGLSNPDQISIQSRQISKVLSKVDQLAGSVQKLIAQVDRQSQSLKQNDVAVLNCADQLKLYEKNIGAKVSDLAAAYEVSRDDTARRFEETEATLADINSHFSKVQSRLRDLIDGAALTAKIADVEQSIRTLLSDSSRDLLSLLQASEDQNTEKLKSMQDKIAELEVQLQNISKPTETDSTTSTPKYCSPVPNVIPTTNQTFKNVNEHEFLDSWLSGLESIYGTTLPAEMALVFHSVLLSNQVAVADFKIANSWITALGWQAFARHLVSQPTWASEEDWATGVHHLFSANQGTQPRIVFMHKYDLGLVDCYLSPTLLLWALQQRQNPLQKLFLIPSDSAEGVQSSVMDHSAFLTFNSTDQSNYRLAESFKRSARKLPATTAISPQSVCKWIEASRKIDYDLSPIEKSLEISFSDWVVANFRRTIACAVRLFEEPSAVGIGVKHQLLPWVLSRYGGSQAESLDAYLRQFPDVSY